MNLFKNKQLSIHTNKYIEMYKYRQTHELKEVSKLFNIPKKYIVDICVELSDLMNNYKYLSKDEKVFIDLLSVPRINRAIRIFNEHSDIMKITSVNELIFNLDGIMNIFSVGKKTINKIVQILVDNGYNLHCNDRKINLFYEMLSVDGIKTSILRYNKMSKDSEINSLDDLYFKSNNIDFIVIFNDCYKEELDIIKINNMLIKNRYNTKNMRAEEPIELLYALLSIIYKTEFNIEGIKMKQVVMEAIIKVIKPLNHKSFDIGGFNFTIEGKKIPFDFNATGYNIELKENESIITYVSGEGPFFKEYDIDKDSYEKEYNNLGLTSNDITAEFLSNVEEINEFYFGAVDYEEDTIFKIEKISFMNEGNIVYNVAQTIIDKFNN